MEQKSSFLYRVDSHDVPVHDSGVVNNSYKKFSEDFDSVPNYCNKNVNNIKYIDYETGLDSGT